MEFITDITVIIDEVDYKDPGRLMEILQSYRAEKKASCYTVKGTYEELEKLAVRLAAVRRHSSAVTQRPACQQRVKPVLVSGFVMEYMEHKCKRELKKIQGNTFAIETQPDSNGTVQVAFRSHRACIDPVHAEFVRGRFITLYQRTASDLQVTSVLLGPHDPRDLQCTFPHLLFKPSLSRYEVTVTGTFVHIAKFKEFLRQNAPSPSKGPVNRGPTNASSSRTLREPSAHSRDPEEEPCPICMESIVATEKETLRCKHSFCRGCLTKAFDYKPVCPTCGELFGTLTGTQPDGGKMKVTINSSSSLPGYEKYGTIIIHYYIPGGIQKEEHPKPGHPYEGVSRMAYLPDSSEGRRILTLLRRAFDQRLIFTVGQSTTSGRNNMITWNDIHHKTSTHGGPTQYGYPDPDYLSRVRDELKVKGIE